MVEIRKLQPSFRIALPSRESKPGRSVRSKLNLKVVERRRKDFPPPTPQPSPCVIWQGSVDPHGYGRRKVERRGARVTIGVHRWVMEELLGRHLTSDEFILHACDNPPCFAVAHLSVGTVQENNRDMYNKGRATKPPNNVYHGDKHPMAKLTNKEVNKARSMSREGLSAVSIAKEFAVAPETIRRILRGERWAHQRDLYDEIAAEKHGLGDASSPAVTKRSSSVKRLSIPKELP